MRAASRPCARAGSWNGFRDRSHLRPENACLLRDRESLVARGERMNAEERSSVEAQLASIFIPAHRRERFTHLAAARDLPAKLGRGGLNRKSKYFAMLANLEHGLLMKRGTLGRPPPSGK
jgi:hypothetical protein